MNHTRPFFVSPGPMTRPGPHAPLLRELPPDIPSLVRIVQGLVIHVFWADQHGVRLDTARCKEVQLRDAAARLARILELDPRPLAEPRDPGCRLVGNFRDFSVMLVTFLRYHGVPARARGGRYDVIQAVRDHQPPSAPARPANSGRASFQPAVGLPVGRFFWR